MVGVKEKKRRRDEAKDKMLNDVHKHLIICLFEYLKNK